MRLVVALGGNALLRRGERPDAGIQLEHVRAAARALAPLAHEHELVVVHGNGPQVGMLALQSEADATLSRPYPLDVLTAQTQGMIGYWLAHALPNAGVTRPVVSLLTQTEVDLADPAFRTPTKPIGPVYDGEQAQRLAAEHDWTVAPDGPHWRRTVPSPEPVRVIEQDAIRQLLDAGTLVVCGGGGGCPVTDNGTGRLDSVEAVIDKDLTAALLAVAVGADRLLVLTDVQAVMTGFGGPQAAELRHADLDQLAAMRFPAGAMGPKIEACRRFVAATGGAAAIGSLDDPVAVLAGEAGTTITASGRPPVDARF